MAGKVIEQTVEIRNELLEAPIIKEGPKKGQRGDVNLVENTPIVMDGPNRGKILNKSFKSLAPDNEYGLQPGLYAYDKDTGDILCNKPIHPWRSNDAVTKNPNSPQASTKSFFENPLGLLAKMQEQEARLAALEGKKVSEPAKAEVKKP